MVFTKDILSALGTQEILCCQLDIDKVIFPMNPLFSTTPERMAVFRETLKRHANYNLLSASKSHTVGNVARTFCSTAIESILLGVNAETPRILARAEEWIKSAIASNEVPPIYVPLSTEADRLFTLSMVHWLQKNVSDSWNLDKFIQVHQAYWPHCKFRNDSVNVGGVLPQYVVAGAYQDALDIYSGTPKFTPPKDLTDIRGEANMVYVICRNRMGQQYSAEEIQTAAHSFLKRNMNTWLSKNHFFRAAMWANILLWDKERNQSAASAILSCLEYLKR